MVWLHPETCIEVLVRTKKQPKTFEACLRADFGSALRVGVLAAADFHVYVLRGCFMEMVGAFIAWDCGEIGSRINKRRLKL